MRLIAGFLALYASGVVDAAPPVPLGVFVRKPEFLLAKVSPHGDYLAVAMPDKSQMILGVIDMRNRKITAHVCWGWGHIGAGAQPAAAQTQ